VIEDLYLAGMARSMGRRAFRRSPTDAGLGGSVPCSATRPSALGGAFIAERYFASTKTHHGCGGTLTGEKLEKTLACEACGDKVDRDKDAAKNLRNWPESNANPGGVGAIAPLDPGPPSGGTDGGSDDRSTGHRTRRRKTNLVLAALGEARTKARASELQNPARGASG